jgi:hypothetical protein
MHGNVLPRTLVGATPDSVKAGGITAREQVIDYAKRIDASWGSFMKSDLELWLASNGLPKDERLKLVLRMRRNRSEFLFWVFGPGSEDEDVPKGPPVPGLTSDSAALVSAWMYLEQYESLYRKDRLDFADNFAPLKSPLAPLPGLGGGGDFGGGGASGDLGPPDKPKSPTTPVAPVTAKDDSNMPVVLAFGALAAVVAVGFTLNK